jgi:hypothetical protein
MVNPFQPPVARSAASADRSPAGLDNLRNIARHQRSINRAILAQIGVLVVTALFGTSLLFRLAFLVVGVATLIAEVRLARRLHGILVALLCAPLMFVPLLNLIVLVVFNQTATKRLREAGYKVGLLGGRPDDIR